MNKTTKVSSVLLGLAFLAGCNQQQLTQQAIPAPTGEQSIQTTTQPTKKTTNWTPYENKELGFSLEIPSTISVEEVLNDKYNRMVSFKGEGGNFDVRLKEDKKTTLDGYSYLDFEVSSKSTLGGKEAVTFEAPKGYCDGPGCTDPFIVYSTKNGDDFYNISFNGDTKMNDTEKAILASFKFLK